jgi:hypothetical protein
MPTLDNPQYEIFARARARGALLEDAYEDAGYTAHNGHAHRVANRVEVRERIAELRREQAEVEDASPRAIVEALVRMARASEKLNTAAGAKEARTNLLEAFALERKMAETRRDERGKLYFTAGWDSPVPDEDRPTRAKRPPADRPPTAIEPPPARPPAALAAPADRPATADARLCNATNRVPSST